MASDSIIYAEYFGVSNTQITFDDLPNADLNIPFYFLVSFAVDSEENGNFTAGWYPKFDAKTISVYRNKHLKPGSDTESKTKFILSITSHQFKGGDGWTDKATESIKDLIDQYTFDGIDICFSGIDETVTAAYFANRVAELIRRLRQQNEIGIISISPTPALDDYYQTLYNKLQSDEHTKVDFVYYRFYDLLETPVDFKAFKDAIKQVKDDKYPLAKVRVGNKTNDKSNGKIDDTMLFKAYKQVPGLHGIFGWAADESPSGFTFEKDAPEVLAKISQV